MKIAIVGGGSIGLLYTYYLSQYHDVILYVRSKAQWEKIKEDGLSLKKNMQMHRVKITVKHIEDWENDKVDLSVICVKQYHLKGLEEKVLKKKEQPFLFLQNGMGHIEWLEALDLPRVLVGVVEHGALKMGDNIVSHTGEGETKISVFRGLDNRFIRLFVDSIPPSFPFRIEPDYREMLVKKLVVNSVVNPLTAILKVKNGTLVDNPYFFRLFKQLFSEVALVLQLEKERDYYETVVRVCQRTGQNRSSMLKDLDEHRMTEIDAILGYLLKEAEKKKIQPPLIQLLYQMIKGSELERGGT